MKLLKYLIIGAIFGIILSKAEIISWFRIYEMFQFESFHMYGIIGSAILTGVIGNLIIKRLQLKTFDGDEIVIELKSKSITKYLVGGSIFGLGWALTGACPGPMFILLGRGVWPILIVIISAVIGTFIYGIVKEKLPH